MNAFQKTAVVTTVAVLLLIAVGSLVRVSGAGLGCPDWPKCWGRWLPPSGIDELDVAYVQAKGYDLRDFNRVKMWTEYLNRLLGVTIGFLVLATALRAAPYRKTRPVVFRCALAGVVLVGVEGWLGGRVVKSGLHPGLVTLHLALALALVGVLLYAVSLTMKRNIACGLSPEARHRLVPLAGLLFGLTCLQVVSGAQVREAIDPLIKEAGGLPRTEWLAQAGWIDYLHRSSSWLILGAGLFLYRRVRSLGVQGLLRHGSVLILGMTGLQMLLGAVLAYGGLPPAFQVLHLTSATLLICTEFAVLLIVRSAAA